MAASVSSFSPTRLARIGGLAYLVIILAGLFGEAFVRGKLIASGDAAATAEHILANASLWRAGIALDIVMHVGDVILMLVLYTLLKPVNARLALLAMLFTLMQTAVLVANKLTLVIALLLIGSPSPGDPTYLQGADAHTLQAVAYVFIKTHGVGFGVGLIFFGCECLVTGHLIRRSTFLPWLIGLAMQLAGLCYLVNSFALLLAPALANQLFPLILVPAFFAELSLCLWLLIRGVDAPAWQRIAAAAA